MANFISFIILTLLCTHAWADTPVFSRQSVDELDDFRVAVLQELNKFEEEQSNFEFNAFHISIFVGGDSLEINRSYFANSVAETFSMAFIDHLSTEIAKNKSLKQALEKFKNRRSFVNLSGHCADDLCMANRFYPKSLENPSLSRLKLEGYKNDGHDEFREALLLELISFKEAFDRTPAHRYVDSLAYSFNIYVSFDSQGLMSRRGGRATGFGDYLADLFAANWNRKVKADPMLSTQAARFGMQNDQVKLFATSRLSHLDLTSNTAPPRFDGLEAFGSWTVPPQFYDTTIQSLECRVLNSPKIDKINLNFWFNPHNRHSQYQTTQTYFLKNGSMSDPITSSYDLTWINRIFRIYSNTLTSTSLDYSVVLTSEDLDQDFGGELRIGKPGQDDVIFDLTCRKVKIKALRSFSTFQIPIFF